jgi:cellulose synthase/poly-beta-1,6-N-acetylglucosamine synthase-like glycosyltransferase/peptidoglycan/xylan/chitin deacetylase (PgdA/CDA1 family)
VLRQLETSGTLDAPPGRGRGVPRRIVNRVAWPTALFALVLVVGFSSVLLVHAYVTNEFVPDHHHVAEGYDHVPDAVSRGGPVLDTSRTEQVRTYGMPARTIALTFDDGPDPRWTPKIADVLRKHDVEATFFVLGSETSRHPGIVRELVADGHELGVHSFSHPRLSNISRWRRDLEYTQTQLALAGATGVNSSLLRFPYSSSPDAVDNAQWPLLSEARKQGYVNVLIDIDSEDWGRPGVEQIIRNSTPRGDAGGIVLMHDAGGDRSQTVAALDQYIPRMKAAGFRFTTVSAGLNLALANSAAGVGVSRPSFVANPPASPGVLWRGRALVWSVQIADWMLSVFAAAFIVIGLLTIVRTIAMFVSAGVHVRRRRPGSVSWGPPVTEPVSVVVPAYNEKEGIAAAVRSLAGGDHPEIEVVVVDDGSTDDTAAIADGLGLRNVRVVRVANGGKSAALNVGVAMASHDLIVMVDGDTVFEPESLRRLVQPFGDPRVGAVAGNVKVGNRGSIVARWQHIEYVIGFNLDRRFFDLMQCMPTVPGAIGAFRRQALNDVGGVSSDTLAEDTDLTMALGRAGWRVVYEETARAWTEAPATLQQLCTQRYRWSYGTMQAMWKHRRALFESGPSGRFGRICLPFLGLFQVAMPLLAPVIDVLALYGLVFYDRTETATAWLGMLGLQFLTAVVAFRLDKESLRPLWVLPLQQFVYRQLMYLVLMQSVITALTGARLRWQKLRRTGGAAVLTSGGR